MRSAAYGVGLQAAVAIILFAAVLLLYGFRFPLHHDLAGSALSGRLAVTLGDAFSGYNIYFPPVEKFWFSAAARLSDLTGLRLDLAVITMTSAMVFFGATLAYRIRCTTVGASPLFFLLPLAVLMIVPILFKNIFGLREHLVVVGLWPYLVLRLSDPDDTLVGARLRVVVGLWLGVTLLFKYVYSVVVVLVEIADALVRRKFMSLFRIENILAGAVVFLYLFFWLGVDPEQRAMVGAMVGAIDVALVDPVKNLFKAARNLLLAVALLSVSLFFGVSKRQTALALAAALGAVIAAWAQERWFSHHLFPITMAYIFWWWIGGRHFRWWINAVIALFLISSIHRESLSISKYHKRIGELEQAMERNNLPVAGKRVAILNPHPSPYNEYLVSRGGLRWTPLMNNAYVAAELKPFDTKENAGKLLPPVKLDEPGRKMLHDQMLRLWEDVPPDVLILDRTSPWPLRHNIIDWKQAFSNDPRFNDLMKHYRRVFGYRGDLVTFEYYVRIKPE